MESIIVITAIVLAVLFFFWLGLKLKPAPYPAFSKISDTPKSIPLPAGLPAPVERFYRTTYGENIPVITSAVLSGRGTMAPFGLPFPIRFRFIYDVGKSYCAMFNGTFYRLPWMKAIETVMEGHAIGRMPTGVDEGPWFDDAMNVRVYCEILHWFPAALLTTPGVCWEPLDDETAMLVLPFGKKQQRVLARFDPESGELRYFEAMKYRSAKSKVLWVNGIWFDQGKPWISMNTEDTLYNVPVHEAISGLRNQSPSGERQ